MIANPYEIYLVPELSKLRHSGNVNDLLSKVQIGQLIPFNIPNDIQLIRQTFTSKAGVEAFVGTLTETETRQLTQLLSVSWRNNSVYRTINQFNDRPWRIQSIEINSIYTRDAEPHLKPLFRRHNMKLTDIVNDEQLWQSDPYTRWDNTRVVEYPILLAVRPNTNDYTVFDGIHRAIALVAKGSTTLDLCFPDT